MIVWLNRAEFVIKLYASLFIKIANNCEFFLLWCEILGGEQESRPEISININGK